MTKKFFVSTILASLTLSAVAVGCGTGAEATAGTTHALSAAEREGGEGRGPGSFLERFDRDGDGVVRITELPPRMQERLGPADTNRDGVLSTEEMQAFHQARRAERFATLDTNRDGAVTEAEAGPRWEHLGRADANNDGRVTLDEFAQHRPRGFGHFGRGGRHGHGGPRGPEAANGPRGGFDPARMIAHLDRNGDGVLQREEVPARMQTRFETVDANRDGALSAEEITAAMAQRRAARAARVGEGPQGSGR